MKKKLLSTVSKGFLSAGALSFLLLTACDKLNNEVSPENEGNSGAALKAEAANPGQAYVANELLVKFRKGTNAEARIKALNLIEGKVTERILTKAMERFGETEALLVIHTPLRAIEAISKINGTEAVEFAEPNFIYQHQATSNDTYYANGQLWGMYGDLLNPKNQYGCQANEAWANGKTGSADVYVGIIDEGIQFNHPDLDGQIWSNAADPADGIDNDGNGYVDDIHGWDFDGNNNSIYDGGTKGGLDDHGTHVAGTIGAKGGNGAGVVGVNWNIKIISCKFLGRRGGTTANAVKAVDYLTTLKTQGGLNIVASNNSWGGGGYSKALYDAIERANAADILFIAAAGNNSSNNDAVANYPSNYLNSNLIAVASITSTGGLSSFSNYGATKVHIGAPGSGIISTTAYNSYSNYSGTSMATPHVTGAAALYAASHAGTNAQTIKNAILNSSVPTTSLANKCTTGGRLNVSGF